MNHSIKEDQIMDSAKSAEDINMQPRVAILLCTYNGQEFLQEQLDSFVVQTHSNWVLYVSDDGSTDSTLQIIENFAKRVGKEKVIIFKGPRKGFAANFLSLIHHDEIKADYFSFADQDDVWLPKKIEAALNWLTEQPRNIPALYCSRTILIDSEGKELGKSDLFLKPPSFANALVQSIGGGNTMVLNSVARNLVSAHSPRNGIISHDWWVYILVSGNEGIVKYDSVSHIKYRQHSSNLVGMNGTWLARIRRIIMLFQGCFKEWNNRNEDHILANTGFLTKYNLSLFVHFTTMRKSTSPFTRLSLLRASQIYRQTFLGNLGLIVATFFKKI